MKWGAHYHDRQTGQASKEGQEDHFTSACGTSTASYDWFLTRAGSDSPMGPFSTGFFSQQVLPYPIFGQAYLSKLRVRIDGSHKRLEAKNYPQLTFWPHEGKEVTPKIVKDYLVRTVGLSVEEALELLK